MFIYKTDTTSLLQNVSSISLVWRQKKIMFLEFLWKTIQNQCKASTSQATKGTVENLSAEWFWH